MDEREGLLIGGGDAAGFRELAWRSGGRWSSRISPYTRRATLYAGAAGAWMEFHLPQGRWRLMLVRHGWSGHVLVREAGRYAIHDLYAPEAESGMLEIPVEAAGEAEPVRIEATGMRHPDARACQLWFLGLRSGAGVYHPELGRKASPHCRLIEAAEGRFLALRTDTGVADYLAAAGTWEPDSLRIFSRHVPGSRVVVDVGANIGHHSIALSRLVPGGRVLAFEPQMQMYNLLNANIALNGCANVTPFRMGLGAREAVLRMYPISYGGFANFGALGIRPDEAPEGEAVPVLPLDALLERQGIPHRDVGFLKMDVQSYEFFVLQGAARVLEEARPAVYCEIAPRSMRRAGYDYREIYALLDRLGYGFLDDAEAPHAPPDWDGESAAEWNILALPDRQRAPLVLDRAPASPAPAAPPPVHRVALDLPPPAAPAAWPEAEGFALPTRISDLPRFAAGTEPLIDEQESGAWAFICRDPALLQRIGAWFGRDPAGLTLKIWQYPYQGDDLRGVNWGRYFNLAHEPGLDIRSQGNLLLSLKAQNFAAMAGLAPRIHGLFLLEGPCGTLHPGILTEDAALLRHDAEPPLPEDLHGRIAEFCARHGLNPPFGDLATPGNHRLGTWVDWQYAYPTEAHVEFLRTHYLRHTQFGESKYQTAPGLGIGEGIRDTLRRVGDLGLDRIEFGGATVLDIGCNGGQFLNYAAARGARHGLGLDWPETARAAAYASNHLGHFNIDYRGAALHEGLPEGIGGLDVVLYLAMVTHLGVPDWLHGLGRRLVLEINHAHQVEATLAALEPHWWLRFVGKASDHGDRAIYHGFSRRHFPRAPEGL
ncbi:FkbM family methyltransferase [Belnapia sp. T6]|uniref:FkbM family methyltransferase n=1 Tax=Belnapia mucosa TaxID=2804532 RepID=A0ABS1V782_9PROT|nr:FkbM family methyltransferase [Belnapia mucosa]MBL6457510.1 FkbM family methyltransferase [Belnapia mucosa]